MSGEVRVRFAPSPTGPLHIGGLRTALYNYLWARKNQGRFIVRIEDTDRHRYVSGAEAHISDALSWCGIRVDESPWTGGDYGPYCQSERTALYLQEAKRLVAKKQAYYAFDTSEELEKMRNDLVRRGAHHQHYNALTRLGMCNSFTLSAAQLSHRLAQTPYVIRMNMPVKTEVVCVDSLRGTIRVESATLEDKVLIKADGQPTYHFAHVVDDYHMRITDVIRGEEWLSSFPVHVMLWNMLGWQSSLPRFTHVSVLLRSDGGGKLSKRAAEVGKFPLYALRWGDKDGFREEGYLAEALVNFLACLGWSAKQEIMRMEELIADFDIKSVSIAGQRFDAHKVGWYNEKYLSMLSASVLIARLQEDFPSLCKGIKPEALHQMVGLMRGRLSRLSEVVTKTEYMRIAPQLKVFPSSLASHKETLIALLSHYAEILKTQPKMGSPEQEKIRYLTLIKEHQLPIGGGMKTLRWALTAKEQGPDLMEIVALLGTHETLQRVKNARDFLTKPAITENK